MAKEAPKEGPLWDALRSVDGCGAESWLRFTQEIFFGRDLSPTGKDPPPYAAELDAKDIFIDYHNG